MRLISLLLLVALLGACGSKGPLTLTPKPARHAKPEKPAPAPQPAQPVQNPDKQDPYNQ